jgi:hypothetical protein
MLIKETIYTRPSLDVEFYDGINDLEFIKHWKETYKATGKNTAIARTLSEDQLTLTHTSIWEDEAFEKETETDPICIANKQKREAYNTEHNITTVSSTRNTI